MMILKIASFIYHHSPIQVLNRLKVHMCRKNVKVLHSPCYLTIDLTTACNLKCPWCSTKKYRSETPSRQLSLSGAKELLNKFKTATLVGFCGAGEPFLNPDLFEMARYANQLKMKVLITTNGTLLSSRMNELLNSKIHTLEISLKGISDEEYQRIIRKNNFRLSSILDAVTNLSKSYSRPNLVMSYVCNKRSVHNIPRVLKIANRCGVDKVYFYNLIPNQDFENESDCLFEDDRHWVSRILSSSMRESNTILVKGPGFYARNSFSRKCKMPFKSLRVGPDGEVSGCSRAINPSHENGNAFIDNNVFNSEHFQNLRSEHLDIALPLRYECLYCDERC